MKEEGAIVSDDLNGNRYFPTQTTLPRTQENLRLHVGLFLATAYTTTVAGMIMSPQLASMPVIDDWRILIDPRYLVYGLPFSTTLLIILVVHEMGHYVTSRRWGVRASLPYFIPFPSFIGTLGAVIKLRSQIPNRRALIDIGASGPIAGFVMSVIAWSTGLHMSKIV
ncbi:MAG: site-2 protease family protein, partial [Gemmatimonadota bacterium]|nr:site-2 protease family protein [Gemmatimonadota bacterium]